MTGPNPNYWQGFNPTPFGGPGVGVPDQIRQDFLSSQQHREFETNMAALLASMQQPLRPAPGQTAIQAGQVSDQQQGLITYQGTPDTELLGQAKAWGIDESFASQMPRDELIKLLDQVRRENRPDDLMAPGFDLAAMFALGAGEAITGGLKRLPFVGEHLARVQALQKADMWLNYAEETVRATIPQRLQFGASTAEMAGQLAAMWFPAAAAWNIAGVAGKIIPYMGRVTPFLRAAAQGAVSGGLLEGGSEHPMLSIGIGAMLGPLDPAAQQLFQRYGPQIAALRSRVTSAFGGLWESRVSPLTQLGPEIPAWMRPGATEIPAAGQLGPNPLPQGLGSLEWMAQHSADPAEREQARFFLAEITRGRQAATAGMNIPVDPRKVQVPGFTPTGLDVVQERELAESMAAQMNKQSMIVESSSLPDAARAVQPNEATVAAAAAIDNPGGVNIVGGIANPSEFVQPLENIPHIRFARRGDRLDALTSDAPITDEMVSQYEQFGMYAGQEAHTSGGAAVRILELGGEMARVKPLYHSRGESIVPISSLSPSPVTSGVSEVPEAWESFNRYVDYQLLREQQALGSALTPERMGVLKTQNLNTWADEFLEARFPGASAGEKARIKQYFNERHVQSFQALAPEESALQEQATAAASAAEIANPPTPITRVEALADSKGFLAIPDGEGNWKVVDNLTDGLNQSPPTAVHFNDLLAAEAWLKNIHRPVPDISPVSEVPAEVAAQLPTGAAKEPRLDNAKYDAALAANTEDLAQAIETDDPALALDLRTRIETAKSTGRVRFLQQAWEYGLARWQPMRARMSTMERKLIEMGFPEIRPFFHWDNIAVSTDKNHNWSNKHLDRWADLTDKFDSKDIRSGLVTELFALHDDAQRIARATAKGMTPEQIASLQEMNRFFPDVIADLGIATNRDAANEVRNMLTHIRTRQFSDIPVSEHYKGLVPNEVNAAMLEHLQGAHTDLRELNAQHLGNIFVRSLGFNHFVKPSWELAEQHIKLIRSTEELAPVADILHNWMKLMRHGYQPGADVMLDAIHSVASFMIPGLSKAQVRSVFNAGLTLTHRALLGLRPDVWARDSIQLLLAAPRVGQDLFATIGRYANATEEMKAEIWERGIKAGWIHLGKPRIAQPGMFEDPLMYVEDPTQAGSIGQLVEQPPPSRRYKVAQAVADWLHDVTPSKVRHIQGTWMDPLMIYTKQGERMRLFVGEAGYQRALRALNRYKDGTTTFDEMMGETAARTFEPAVAKKFKDLVASGTNEEAAAFMGRQMADATQFRYGVSETAEISRGMVGKMGMQMGNFSQQFYQYAKESIRYGETSDKVKWWAMMGAVTAGLKLAKHATGWNFDKWQFYNSLGFTGGPWMQVAADVQAGLAAQSQMAQRPEGPGGEILVQEANRLPTALRDMTQMINPIGGGLRTVSNVLAAQESPTPGEATLRALMTGERSASMDWREQSLQHMQQQPGIEQFMPGATPVRGSSFSMPVVPVAPAPSRFSPEGPGGRTGAPWDSTTAPFNPLTGEQQFHRGPPLQSDQMQSMANTLDAAIIGQQIPGFDAEDMQFLQGLRNDSDQTRVQAWLFYQESKRARQTAGPGGGAGSGHQF